MGDELWDIGLRVTKLEDIKKVIILLILSNYTRREVRLPIWCPNYSILLRRDMKK